MRLGLIPPGGERRLYFLYGYVPADRTGDIEGLIAAYVTPSTLRSCRNAASCADRYRYTPSAPALLATSSALWAGAAPRFHVPAVPRVAREAAWRTP